LSPQSAPTGTMTSPIDRHDITNNTRNLFVCLTFLRLITGSRTWSNVSAHRKIFRSTPNLPNRRDTDRLRLAPIGPHRMVRRAVIVLPRAGNARSAGERIH
jgi:hypothetical protein